MDYEQKRILVIIHAINKYKKKFDNIRFLEFINKYYLIKTEKNKLEEFNEFLFILWLLDKKIIINRRIRKSIEKKLMREIMDEEMKRHYNEHRLRKNWIESLQELYSQIWHQMSEFEREKVKKDYLTMIINVNKAINEYISSLIEHRIFLLHWVDLQKQKIKIKEEEICRRMLARMVGLPKMLPSDEEAKNSVILSLNKFLFCQERNTENLLREITPHIEKWMENINLPIYNADPSFIKDVFYGLEEDVLEYKKEILIKERCGKIEDYANNMTNEIQQMEKISESLEEEIENPKVDVEHLMVIHQDLIKSQEDFKKLTEVLEEVHVSCVSNEVLHTLSIFNKTENSVSKKEEGCFLDEKENLVLEEEDPSEYEEKKEPPSSLF